jgi:hypothetical protein
MKTYCDSGSIAHKLGTRWKLVISFTSRPLYPRERTSGMQWIEGSVDSTAGLDTADNNKITEKRRETPCPGSEPAKAVPTRSKTISVSACLMCKRSWKSRGLQSATKDHGFDSHWGFNFCTCSFTPSCGV